MENDESRFSMDEERPRFERMAARHENGSAPRSVSVYQLFQTPAEIAAQLVQTLDLQPGARVLEPSAGLGRLIDAIIASASDPYRRVPFAEPKSVEIVAVEQSPNCAAELYRQERDRVRILQRDFLSVTPAELGTFDAIAMNPPFHLRSDIKHIMHALAFLSPGGRIAALCMATQHRREAFRAFTWTDLPRNSFAQEGTGVDVALITYQSPA